ncbi:MULTISPECIES: GGDEF domain-containing protein [unclassified Nitratiruptor]|uniref:GGDEF domain-containing protein n=1 Tax=unclassified Nitratiruptor TaxID=2624044 RepID=UPI001916BED2|nr:MULTISPECIES: GGDEF domain-containing protein [unclassified Nitratiruptor]BCD59935.1 diguanylate cyclase [Nitratiruptor sp. YY08-10]BCD63858.1 diguanylate cyclase [Nitratiruptor sp. YY08-14]
MTRNSKTTILFITLLFVAIIGIIGIYFYFSQDKQNRIDLYLSQKIDQLRSEYRVTKYSYQHLISFFYDTLYDDQEFLRLINQPKDKKRLYQKLLPYYKKLKKYHIHYLSLNKPDGTLLLNMNKPQLTISSKKRFLNNQNSMANKLLITFQKPIYYNNHLVALINLALSYNVFTKELQKLFHAHYEFIVNKLMVQGFAFRYGIYSFVQSDFSPFFYYEKISDKNDDSYPQVIQKIKLKIRNKIANQLLQYQDFATYINIDGNYYVATFLAINNDRFNIGYIVSIKQDNNIKIFDTIFWQNIVIGSILILFLFMMLFYFAMSRIKFEEMATVDKLTGLYNRHKFQEIAESEIKRSHRHKRPLSVILFDIDHFKKINDTYGHDIGDAVLQELAKIIKKNIRKYDYAIRWGGEEFLILAPETDEKQAFAMAEKLRKAVESHTFPEVGKVTISLGVASVDPNESIDQAIKKADNALYSSKLGGRNKTTIAL